MEITVQQVAGVCFSIEKHGRRILCDLPIENGGAGLGLSPRELLLASLGSCAAWCAHRYLTAKSLPATGLAVRVTEEMGASPGRLDHFRIAIRLPPVTDEEHAAGLRSSVEHCLIHYTLLHPPFIEVTASGAHAVGTAEPQPQSFELAEVAASGNSSSD